MSRVSRVIKTCNTCHQSYIWSSSKREHSNPYYCEKPECQPKVEAGCKHGYVAHTCTFCFELGVLRDLKARIESQQTEIERFENAMHTHRTQDHVLKNVDSAGCWCENL